MLFRLIAELLRKRRRPESGAGIADVRRALDARQPDRAAALCEELLAARPRDLEVLHLAGVVALLRGERDRAIALLEQAAQSPTDPQPALGLGQLLFEAGRTADAVVYFGRALQIDPGLYEARFALGNALYRTGDSAAAEEHLRQAAALRPEADEAHALLRSLLHKQARHDELASIERDRQRVRPADGTSILLALLIPAIYGSLGEIEEARARLEREVEELLEGPPLKVADPVKEIRVTPFYLAYHGMNDRDLQRSIARLCRKAYRPARDAPLPARRHGGRIRVGFVSEHFNNHSVGRVNHGLVSGLARDRFEVTVYSLARHDDELARLFREKSDRYVAFDGEPLAGIERAIAGHEMDVLVFTDVGMDALTYFLAYSRLAPLQCVCWGHPDTTGIATLDCYLSADAIEPADAGTHYTERLVRLPAWTMPGYQRVARPAPLKRRGELGLSEDAHLYVCPQMPFKLHPDFDAPLAAILRGDPRAEVVLVEGQHPRLTQLLQRRFQCTMPDVVGRVRVLPHLTWPDYLNLIAVSDVMLDPLHFGGANTSYEGLALAIPVVTLPSAYLRGRHTLGCYLRMGMEECTAATPEHYAQIALKLGTEPDYRRFVAAKIAERSGVLYENGEMAAALGEFLAEACARQ